MKDIQEIYNFCLSSNIFLTYPQTSIVNHQTLNFPNIVSLEEHLIYNFRAECITKNLISYDQSKELKNVSNVLNTKNVLYRCRYARNKRLGFLCGVCLKQIKNLFENTYQYGGTWKSKKK